MEEPYPSDYKLDQGFLLQLITEDLRRNREESFKIELPVNVQITKVRKEIGEWKSYKFSDGEYQMKRCAFISKQPIPENFSILKIKKISNLALEIGDYIDDFSEHSNVQYIFGEIDFDIEVSGEQIGYSLYEVKSNKYINMVEILEKEKVIGRENLIETLTLVDHSTKLARLMWQNRSEKLCDVNFTFSDDQETVAFAHRTVLMSNSDVFDAHFNSEEFRDLNTVPIVDVEIYYFNKFLEFIYTGKVQFTTVKVAFELLYLSKKYLVSPLKTLCQKLIEEYCSANPGNTLKLFSLIQKSNDAFIRGILESSIRYQARIILKTTDFLNCGFGTVEWILSMTKLYIDEWSLLCALYKWARHNGCNAFCQDTEVLEDNHTECLHGLLECIKFENIDGFSLQRFFKLPKLTEIVPIEELKKSTFDSILEDDSYYEHCGPINYSKFRGHQSGFYLVSDLFYIEYMKESNSIFGEATREKNLHLSVGTVFGLKMKIVPDVKNAVTVILAFQFLSTQNEKIEDSVDLDIDVYGSKDKLGKERDINVQWNGTLHIGEHCDLRLLIPDYQDYLTDKIEDMENSGNSLDGHREKVLGLNMEFDLRAPDSDIDSE